MKTTPDIGIIMLAALVYALSRYVLLIHSLLQETSANAIKRGVMTGLAGATGNLPPKKETVQEKVKIDHLICGSEEEDLIVTCEDDMRRCESIKTGETVPFTPPTSPSSRLHPAPPLVHQEEVISSTDCACCLSD